MLLGMHSIIFDFSNLANGGLELTESTAYFQHGRFMTQ